MIIKYVELTAKRELIKNDNLSIKYNILKQNDEYKKEFFKPIIETLINTIK